MTGIDPALAIDGLVAVLLAAVIFYAAVLNRRLKAWRAESAELTRLIATFGEAIRRAEAALAGLKAATREEGATLEATRKQAQALRDDLGFMLERGGSLADRLEQVVRAGLAEAMHAPGGLQAQSEPSPAAETAAEPGDRMMSAAERQLIKALEAMR